jgi:hypothetical protein
VEINDDLHLLGEKFKNIALKQEITDRSNSTEVELRAEMVEEVGAREVSPLFSQSEEIKSFSAR